MVLRVIWGKQEKIVVRILTQRSIFSSRLFVSSSNAYIETIYNTMVFVGGTFGSYLCHEVRDIMNEICVPKDPSPLVSPKCRARSNS